MGYIRFSIITIKPLSSLLVRLQRLLHISKLHLIEFSQILLLRRRAAQVSSQYVVLDGTGKHASSILGVCLAVDLERFLEVIGSVVGFVEALSLDGGSFLESLACLLVYLRTHISHLA
jgi:hypothetical protein